MLYGIPIPFNPLLPLIPISFVPIILVSLSHYSTLQGQDLKVTFTISTPFSKPYILSAENVHYLQFVNLQVWKPFWDVPINRRQVI